MIKKIVQGVFFIFLHSQLYANELEYYQCPSEKSALICSDNCVLQGSINFKPEENKILYVLKDQNNTISETLKNCVIKDNKNWSCNFEEIFSTSQHTMVKSRYFSSSSYRMLDGKNDERFSCAKIKQYELN